MLTDFVFGAGYVMAVMSDFVMLHCLHIAIIGGVAISLYEHREYCRERARGMWF